MTTKRFSWGCSELEEPFKLGLGCLSSGHYSAQALKEPKGIASSLWPLQLRGQQPSGIASLWITPWSSLPWAWLLSVYQLQLILGIEFCFEKWEWFLFLWFSSDWHIFTGPFFLQKLVHFLIVEANHSLSTFSCVHLIILFYLLALYKVIQCMNFFIKLPSFNLHAANIVKLPVAGKTTDSLLTHHCLLLESHWLFIVIYK